jgi:hypothetical protein
MVAGGKQRVGTPYLLFSTSHFNLHYPSTATHPSATLLFYRSLSQYLMTGSGFLFFFVFLWASKKRSIQTSSIEPKLSGFAYV